MTAGMLRRLLLVPLSAFFATETPLPAKAEAAPPIFAGLWDVDTGSPAGKCRIELQRKAVAGRLVARTLTCGGPFASLSGWAAQGGGFALLGADGRTIAEVAPARGMMTGRLSDGSLVTLWPVRR